MRLLSSLLVGEGLALDSRCASKVFSRGRSKRLAGPGDCAVNVAQVRTMPRTRPGFLIVFRAYCQTPRLSYRLVSAGLPESAARPSRRGAATPRWFSLARRLTRASADSGPRIHQDQRW